MTKFFEHSDFTLPDDDDDDEAPAENEYDAINDETFGGEIHDTDGDLEEFANRTAGLLLDEPSCSSGMINGTWSESEILPLVKGAKTLEEIEREQFPEVVASSLPPFHQQNQPSPLLDIHRESSVATEWPKIDVASHAPFNPGEQFDYFSRPPPSFPSFSHQLPQPPFGMPLTPGGHYPVGPPLPSQRVPGQWMPPSTNGIHRPYPIRAGLVVPLMPPSQQRGHKQNFPPSRFQQYNYNNNYNNHGSYNNQSREYGHRYPVVHNDFSAQLHRGSTSSLVTSTNGRGRPRGLPSTRTISDFAFDPYAGFMSKKEREWLIKIHLIQCTSTGNPTEDDFYYTMWKKRNVLQKQPRTFKIQPRYYSFDDTYPSAAYVPPTFSGSLGRPSHCSAKIPRQLIDVQAEAVDGDVNKQTQKKLKAILMRIENAYLLLIECESLKRKLAASDLNADDAKELSDRLCENTISLSEMVNEDGVLPTLMMIQKGRAFLFQLMDFCDGDKLFAVLKIVVETSPKYAKKVPDGSILECGKYLYSRFLTLSDQRLVELATLLSIQHDSFSSVRLTFTIVFVFLAAFARRSNNAAIELPNGLLSWLRSDVPPATATAGALLLTASVDELFPEEDQQRLHDWLLGHASDNGADIAHRLLSHLAVTGPGTEHTQNSLTL